LRFFSCWPALGSSLAQSLLPLVFYVLLIGVVSTQIKGAGQGNLHLQFVTLTFNTNEKPFPLSRL